jgi:hypothetical protein
MRKSEMVFLMAVEADRVATELLEYEYPNMEEVRLHSYHSSVLFEESVRLEKRGE